MTSFQSSTDTLEAQFVMENEWECVRRVSNGNEGHGRKVVGLVEKEEGGDVSVCVGVGIT